MFDIKDEATFEKIHPINKGWSSDKKYYIETVTNEKLLLHIANISEYTKKKNEFDIMKHLAAGGISMSQPVDFGICDDGNSVYSLFTWCDGDDAAIVLPKMTEAEQYELGVKSGRILREIHDISAPNEQEQWEKRFNRHDYGDPWEEFNRIVWSAAASPHFATGQLNGYFNGKPPESFFMLLALYISSNTLSSIPWAIPFGDVEITVMKKQADDVFTWFDGMNNPIPIWYVTSPNGA